MKEKIKDFYTSFHDMTREMRFNSPYLLRKYVHRFRYFSIIRLLTEHIKPGYKILDAGCGDGVLLQLMADSFKGKNIDILGADISRPNIQAANQCLNNNGSARNIPLIISDGEALPFADDSLDMVISSHILEHLPDFHKGLNEIRRVTRDLAVIALPTCLNPCAMAQLGGDNFWKIGRRSPYSLFLGFAKVLANLHKDGVQEGYAGSEDLPHLWRYPWIMKSEIRKAGFEILRFEATSLAIPYIASFFPIFLHIQKLFDRLCGKFFFCNFGYGSTVVARKIK